MATRTDDDAPGGVFQNTNVAGQTGQEAPGGQFSREGAIEVLGTAALQGPQGPAGPTGATGATGPTGPQGPTGPAGTPGTAGAQGVQGAYYVKLFQRAASEPSAPTGTWTPPASGADLGTYTGTDSWVTSVPSGTTQIWESQAVFDPATDTNITTWSSVFQGGAQGPAGDTPVFTNVFATDLAAGADPTALLVRNPGTDNYILTFGIPAGATGSTGPAGDDGTTPSFSIGTVNTIAAGGTATVTVTGTDAAPVLNFNLPEGAMGATGPTGAQGATGPAPGVLVGQVTTGAPGSNVNVTRTDNGDGTYNFNFQIPRGNVGAQGPAGTNGTIVTANPSYTGANELDTVTIAGTMYRIGGGSTPAPDHLSVTVTASATELEEGFTGTQTVTYTASVNTGYTIDDIVHASTSIGDANVSVSNNVVTLTVPQVQNNVGNSITTTFRVNVTETADGSKYFKDFTEVLNIHGNWYTELTSTAPVDFTGATDRGIFSEGDSVTITGNNSDALYVWVPTSAVSSTLYFLTGTVTKYPLEYTTSSVTSGDHTRLDFGVPDTGTLTFEIQEG